VCIGVTITFSQLLVRTLVPVSVFTYGHFLLWTLSEVLLVSLIATAIYADYSSTFLQELLISLRFIPTGLVLPYAFSMLVLMLLQQKNRGSGTVPVSPPENPDLIHIRDEREQVKFSIRKDYILYLESSDNYVTVFYLADKEVKKEMVRTSMKKLEALLKPVGLIRCHRSFMVHMENVQWMKKKGRSYQIKMKNCETIVPVSRSYHPVVKILIQE
jgi:DNA-binding LytR/AlgR family response regulator